MGRLSVKAGGAVVASGFSEVLNTTSHDIAHQLVIKTTLCRTIRCPQDRAGNTMKMVAY